MNPPILSQSPAADARLQAPPAGLDPQAPRRHRFEVRYRNEQGALLRLLNAISRRGLDFESVRAEADADAGRLTAIVGANPKHIAQICRDWRVMVDVIEVLQPIDLDREPEQAPRTI